MSTRTEVTAAPKRVKNRPDRPPILNRVEDGCARLGISRWLFYRWIKAGRVSVVKLGTRTLIAEAELQRVGAEIVREARRESIAAAKVSA